MSGSPPRHPGGGNDGSSPRSLPLPLWVGLVILLTGLLLALGQALG